MQLQALVGGAAEVVGPEATLEEAAGAMVDSEATGLAVVDRRELVGIITEHDIVMAVAEGVDPAEEIVEEWMTESPDTFLPDVSVKEAAMWILETGYRHLPVMADDELLGIVSIRDILWSLNKTD